MMKEERQRLQARIAHVTSSETCYGITDFEDLGMAPFILRDEGLA